MMMKYALLLISLIMMNYMFEVAGEAFFIYLRVIVFYNLNTNFLTKEKRRFHRYK